MGACRARSQPQRACGGENGWRCLQRLGLKVRRWSVPGAAPSDGAWAEAHANAQAEIQPSIQPAARVRWRRPISSCSIAVSAGVRRKNLGGGGAPPRRWNAQRRTVFEAVLRRRQEGAVALHL